MSSFMKVDGVEIKCPSQFNWSLTDVSSSDAGRVEDINATMYKNRKAQKRKIELSWNGLGPEDTSKILQAFNPEYFNVYYFDPMDGIYETRTFYRGDASAPFHIWTTKHRIYKQLSFNIIER